MSKVRIGIDISICAFNNAGNARYSRSLLHALRSELHETDLSIVPLSLPHTLQAVRAGLKRKLLVLFWEFVYSPQLLGLLSRRHRCDILHTTVPMPLNNVNCPVVTTIHDVIPILYPEWFSTIMGKRLRRWVKVAAGCASHIIADSHSTAEDVRRILPQLGTPTTVIYPGSFLADARDLENNADIFRYQPYILSVGTLEPRKNVGTVLSAYQALKSRLATPPKLLIVGATGWMAQDIQVVAEQLGIAADVVITGYVSDAQLLALYKNASLLVYPSLYEGFGLPPLEAMSAGCPVITSNVSSLPEVVGEAGLLVNPMHVSQLTSAMWLVLENPKLAARMRQQGKQRAVTFSWRQCAQETLNVYRRVWEAHQQT